MTIELGPGEMCTRGKAHPKTDLCRTVVCDWEGCDAEPFCSDKRMKTHRKSHVESRCPDCGKNFSNNGLTQHRDTCRANPAQALSTLVPVTSWAEAIRDFFEHARVIPDDCYCVITRDCDPKFLPAAKAASQVLDADGPVLVIPASVFPTIQETAKRYRRRNEDDRAERTTSRPATGIRVGGKAAWGNIS